MSRADYSANRAKAHWLDSSLGMDIYRYFMAPEAIISTQVLPQGWGLIEVSPKACCAF